MLKILILCLLFQSFISTLVSSASFPTKAVAFVLIGLMMTYVGWRLELISDAVARLGL
jgi:hypothetical protein